MFPALGATALHDARFDAAGNLAVVGTYEAAVSMGGMTMPAVTSFFDMFAAVLDPEGIATQLWTGGGTALASAQNARWLPDGSLVIAGYFSGMLANGNNLNAGGRQAGLLLRFDPAGAVAFARHYQASSNVQIRGLAVSADRIAIAGLYAGAPDFGAGPLTSTTFDNGFLATMDLAGGDVRNLAFNGNNDVFVNDVALAANGDLCICGRFNTTTNFGGGPVSATGSSAFIARYNSQLALQWVRSFGTTTTSTNIAFHGSGDCIASGEFATISIDGNVHTGAGGSDGWIARFGAAAGAVSWMRTISGTGNDRVPSLAVQGDRITIAAQFQDTVMFVGTQPLVSEGASDAVVAGLDMDGTLVWSKQVGGTGDVDLGLGGMSVNAAGSLAAITLYNNGELRVDGQMVTGGATDSAAIVVAIPP